MHRLALRQMRTFADHLHLHINGLKAPLRQEITDRTLDRTKATLDPEIPGWTPEIQMPPTWHINLLNNFNAHRRHLLLPSSRNAHAKAIEAVARRATEIR